MNNVVFGTVSAFVLASSLIPGIVPSAQAQMRFNFSAPFIADSGIVNASGDTHFITVAVTGYPLEELIVTLPNDMRTLEGAMVTNQKGQEVSANVAISSGSLAISFAQPVAPDDYLTVRLMGVKMEPAGGTALYRISAIKKGLIGQIPIGTAMVQLMMQ